MTDANTSISMKFLADAANMSYDELLKVNAAICEMLRLRQADRQLQAARQFKLNDEVEFTDSRKNRKVVGHIEKINRKSIIVIEKSEGHAGFGVTGNNDNPLAKVPRNIRWTVTPSLLRHHQG